MYIIDDDKIKRILLELTEDDFIKTEESTSEEFPDDIVHIFKKDVSLIKRFFSKDIEPQNVKLYIKFTWTTKTEYGNLIFISFHLWDEE